MKNESIMTNPLDAAEDARTRSKLASADESSQTPVMRQYFAAKAAHPDCLMFCRIGDFYELFYEDAVVAARELQLVLTARDKAKQQPMCGVPYHSAGNYIQRLLRKGYRVALCEQMEDPKLTKTIVRREVTRVLTPGTAVDAALDASESQWLASVAAIGKDAAACVGVAAIDLSTGEFRATEFSGAVAWALAMDELARMRPAEILSARGSGFGGTSQSVRQGVLAPTHDDGKTVVMNGPPKNSSWAPDSDGALELSGARTEVEEWAFTEEYAVPLLRQQLKVHSLDGMGLAGHTAAAVAAGAIVHYLRATKQGALEHLDTLRYYERSDCLELDAVSVSQPGAGRAAVFERRTADHSLLDARCLLHADGASGCCVLNCCDRCSRCGRLTRGWMPWRSRSPT